MRESRVLAAVRAYASPVSQWGTGVSRPGQGYVPATTPGTTKPGRLTSWPRLQGPTSTSSGAVAMLSARSDRAQKWASSCSMATHRPIRCGRDGRQVGKAEGNIGNSSYSRGCQFEMITDNLLPSFENACGGNARVVWLRIRPNRRAAI